MKEVNIYLYELTKEEATKLPNGKTVLIYNMFMKTYRTEKIGPGCLARSRYAADYVKYFVFDREGIDE